MTPMALYPATRGISEWEPNRKLGAESYGNPISDCESHISDRWNFRYIANHCR